MSFEIEAKLFRDIVKSVIGVVGSKKNKVATFVVDRDGLRMKEMDDSHISMVELFLPKILFKEYNVPEKQILHIDLLELQRIFTGLEKNEMVRLGLNEERKTLRAIRKGEANRIFEIELADRIWDEPPYPSLKFTATVKMLSKEFKKAVKIALANSNTVRFSANQKDKSFSISSRGEGTLVNAVWSEGSIALLKVEIEEDTEAEYAGEYLNSIINASAVSDVVTIQFAERKPLKLTFPPFSEYCGGSLCYWLAPQIEV